MTAGGDDMILLFYVNARHFAQPIRQDPTIEICMEPRSFQA